MFSVPPAHRNDVGVAGQNGAGALSMTDFIPEPQTIPTV